MFRGRIVDNESMMSLLTALALTHKGLTRNEIMHYSKLDEEDTRLLLELFDVFLICYKGYYMSHNTRFRSVIDRLKTPLPESEKERVQASISIIFEKSPNNVRKLEEEATHLYRDGLFFLLKQRISTIENFLMLFNPITKFDLFRYWRQLEQRGYDPVIEYNKGVEQFDTQYMPDPDKLFVIILQVCRFLKEFSDFETDVTPVFRHPMIKGKVGVKLKQAKTRKQDEDSPSPFEKRAKEISRTNSITKPAQNKSHSMEHSIRKGESPSAFMASMAAKKQPMLLGETARKRKRLDPMGTKDPFYNKDNELSEIEEPDSNVNREDQATFNYLEKIGLLKELRQFKLTKDMPTWANDDDSDENADNPVQKNNANERQFAEILEDWEDVNVDNPRGRHKFRNHFEKAIAERYNFKRNQINSFEEDIKVGEGLEPIKGRSKSQHLLSELKKPEDEDEKRKHEYLDKIDDIDLELKPEKHPSFYYYKR